MLEEKIKKIKKRIKKKWFESTRVNQLNLFHKSWEQDNSIGKKMKRFNKVQFLTNLMLEDEIEKKIKF
jgi:hypothetical protein